MTTEELASLIKQKIVDFSLDIHQPIFPRDLSLGEQLPPKAGNLVKVIVGMRRSGKTYRLFQEIEALQRKGISSQSILYFNFEDSRLPPLSHSVGDEVLRIFFEMFPQAKQNGSYIFLDEIQEMPDWGIWLRRVVDTEKTTIFVTGSSAKVLAADVDTQFRGRSLTTELLPFGFSEYLRFHKVSKPDNESYTTAENLVLKQHFESYLIRGGFPAVQNEEIHNAFGILQSYAELAVARDVIERHNLNNPREIAYFANIALRYNGRELSLRKTQDMLRSQGVKADRRSLSEALRYFEDAFLLGTVKPLSRALAEDPRISAKIYAIDPGLAAANAIAPAKDQAQLLEAAVYLEMRRRNPHARERFLSSYRTQEHGYEVDFIVGDILFGEQEFYQVCVSLKEEKTLDREIRALREAMKESKTDHSTVITLDNEEKSLVFDEGTVAIIPVWKWILATS